MDPWFSEQMAGVVGGGLGAGVGVVFGGIGGGVGGPLAAKGKAKSLVLGFMYAAVAIGVVLLGIGIVALVDRQPWYVWYSFGLPGFLSVVVMGPLIPVLKSRYAQHEQRKLDVDAIRSA